MKLVKSEIPVMQVIRGFYRRLQGQLRMDVKGAAAGSPDVHGNILDMQLVDYVRQTWFGAHDDQSLYTHARWAKYQTRIRKSCDRWRENNHCQVLVKSKRIQKVEVRKMVNYSHVMTCSPY